MKYGKIKFGKPKDWISVWEVEGSGRGDLMEGAYASFRIPEVVDYDNIFCMPKNITKK